METIKPLVSVIVPAFNCGSLVCDTVKSIQAQRLTDFELIIINDGSTDNTLEVLQKLAAEDSRINVITVANGGPAKARNVGIENAVGEYLCFFDSDDLVDSEMLFEMYELAEANTLDAVCCGYNMENVSDSTVHYTRFGYDSFVAATQGDFRNRLMDLIKAHLMYVVWNKLYRTAFIRDNSLHFDDFLSGEDRLFNIKTYAEIKRFGCIDKPFYRYFLRGQQTLANRYVENRFDSSLLCHRALIESYEQMGLYKEKNRAYIDFAFIKTVMSCFTQLNSKGCKKSLSEKKEYIAEVLKNEYVKSALFADDDEFSYSKIINKILKSNNKMLIYLTSKGIYLMQFKLNTLYLRIKHSVKPKGGV